MRSVEDSIFKSVTDSIWWNFPMPEFVLLRDRGYGYYDCQCYYFLDWDAHEKIRKMVDHIKVKNMANVKAKLQFYEEQFREEIKRRFESFKK